MKFINKTIKALKNLFIDDWSPVWSLSGHWGFSSTVFSYQIQYSPSRCEHRLIVHGWMPKSQPQYSIAIAKLNELRMNGLSERDTY